MASRSFLLPSRWLAQRLAANPKFRHATDYDGSPSGLANGNGRSALPKRSHGANLSVQSPIFRGMPVEARPQSARASQSGLFSRGRSKAANLVNVHIHQFQPGGAVVDAAALAQFQEQWATCRKLVESDCLAHRKVGGILRETLNDTFTSPFCFLDIAGGDASTMKSALRGTQVRHYQASTCRNQPLRSLTPISPRYPSRSISTTAISWRPCCAGPSMPMRPGAACRSITCRRKTSCGS